MVLLSSMWVPERRAEGRSCGCGIGTDWRHGRFRELQESEEALSLRFHRTGEKWRSSRAIRARCGWCRLPGDRAGTLAENARTASWSDDGWLYFMGLDFAISRVPDTGGEIETVTQLAERDRRHTPHPMPGGKVLLYTVVGRGDLYGSDAAIWSMDMETGERKMMTAGSMARYAASGHLLSALRTGT